MQKFTLRASMIFFLCLISFLIVFGPAFGADKPFIFGVLMVGSHLDNGRSQTHYEAGKYVEKILPGTKMIYIDKVNPTDRPGMTIPLLVDDMVEKGASLIIASNLDMQDGVREAALQHPDIYFIHVSGDDVLTNKAPKNLSNLTARAQYGQMMAGMVAALTTKTAKIGYVGALADPETLSLASSAYLGAKYGWQNLLKKDPNNLKFEVIWIGWWINLPGVTADPARVAGDFFDAGFDVVISGIDTNEVLAVAKQKYQEAKKIWSVGSSYVEPCEDASDVCLGVPIVNWGLGYVRLIKSAMSGNWKSQWVVLRPDWKDLNNPDSSGVGFFDGPALSPSAKAALDTFIDDLASKRLKLLKGPLNYQDGKPYLKTGETVGKNQVWFMRQLLQGMTGESKAKKSD